MTLSIVNTFSPFEVILLASVDQSLKQNKSTSIFKPNLVICHGGHNLLHKLPELDNLIEYQYLKVRSKDLESRRS